MDLNSSIYRQEHFFKSRRPLLWIISIKYSTSFGFLLFFWKLCNLQICYSLYICCIKRLTKNAGQSQVWKKWKFYIYCCPCIYVMNHFNKHSFFKEKYSLLIMCIKGWIIKVKYSSLDIESIHDNTYLFFHKCYSGGSGTILVVYCFNEEKY